MTLREVFFSIFTRIHSFIKWFDKENRHGHSKSLSILLILFFFNVIAIILFKNIKLFAIWFCFIIFIMLIKLMDNNLKYLPKKIKGNSNNFRDLLNTFNTRAYLVGIILFSFYFILLLYILIQFPLLFFLDYSLLINIENLYFPSITIFTIYYFMYHVVIKKQSTKLARSLIHLYVAISISISLLFFVVSLDNVFTPMITWLGVGYAWLNYFLARIDNEDELNKGNF
ncbi:hypothetical protein [Pseudalkalibacillus salsuginis]|uniref:hypothetical protein n=1 Tax=Pseudalkalibacillus salsuginis TaxID=2910972 RepID=UPI001F243A77|nr:hypothetical protein [Pseudalkalibacillus salsuginis]MCF6410674.1 hypothetical protein [Pseudalkalibacillus salsuginis]